MIQTTTPVARSDAPITDREQDASDLRFSAPGSTAILEFQEDDDDAECVCLKDKAPLVHELKINRTFQFRDPEGNAVSLYMPATDAARQRFGGR